MKLYADSSTRRTVQIIGDVFLVCFVAVCGWLGKLVGDGIGALRRPADGLTSVGSSIQENMAGIADQMGNIPLVGSGVQAPFQSLSGTGQQLASAGASIGSTVDTIARVTGIAVAVVPIVLALAVWAFFRVRFVRRATAASQLVGAPGALELLALRALTRQPLRRLTALGPDVAGRFRDGDPVVVRQLAGLELRACGLSLDGGETTRPVTRLA